MAAEGAVAEAEAEGPGRTAGRAHPGELRARRAAIARSIIACAPRGGSECSERLRSKTLSLIGVLSLFRPETTGGDVAWRGHQYP